MYILIKVETQKGDSIISKDFFIIFIVCVCTCVCVHMSAHAHRARRWRQTPGVGVTSCLMSAISAVQLTHFEALLSG